jgi:circadian clock protein KaiC
MAREGRPFQGAPRAPAAADAAVDLSPSGVPGLDQILHGGFIPQALNLLSGGPGTGKTTAALQFLLAGVQQGEPGLHVTLAQTRGNLERIMRSHGWSAEGIHSLDFRDLDAALGEDNTIFQPDELELSMVIDVIVGTARSLDARRVVLDTLSEIRLLAGSELRIRRQLVALKQRLVDAGCTVLVLEDSRLLETDLALRNLADAVVLLEQRDQPYGCDWRRLRVAKVRGGAFEEGYHDLRIRRGGLQVYPRIDSLPADGPELMETVSTGNPDLDQMLNGGLERGTRVLAYGPTGVGKTTLACQVALALAARGQRSLICAFDETEATLRLRLRSLGQHAQRHLEEGQIQLRRLRPGEMGAGELARWIADEVAAKNHRLVVIDSLNGLEQVVFSDPSRDNQLQDLLSYLGAQGVVSMLTLAQWGPVLSDADQGLLSFLSDTILALQYYESEGAIHRSLSVVKKRCSMHDHRVRELIIDRTGIRLGETMSTVSGLLGGIRAPSESMALAEQDGAAERGAG